VSKKTEVAVKDNSGVFAPTDYGFDAFADLPRAENSDFDIPRLILVQPTSKLDVGEKGDIVDSSDNSIVSSLGKKLTFVPVWFMKDYSISEVDSKKWRRNEAKTPANSHYSIFDNRLGADPDGVDVQRSERLNLFLVQETHLDQDLPRVYRMVLKPSSFKEAKKFLSEWDIQIRSRLCPFSYIWGVTPKEIRNEKGKFVILEFNKEMADGRQRQVTKEQFEKVQFWVKTLMANKDKVEAASGPDDEEQATPEAPKDFEQGKLNF
jgi:hypothetical protein